jgi:hypothetical protein
MSGSNGNGKSAAEEILAYEREVNTALKRIYHRNHYEPSHDDTPVEALLEPMLERDELDDLTIDQLHDRIERAGIVLTVDVPARDLISILRAVAAAEREMRRVATLQMFDYFKADGVHPADVLKRVYAVGNHMGIEPFSLLTTRARGLMLGDSHGAQHWRMEQICVNPLLRAGAKSVKAPGQKGLNARAAAARAQQGNSNRRRKRRSRRTA